MILSVIFMIIGFLGFACAIFLYLAGFLLAAQTNQHKLMWAVTVVGVALCGLWIYMWFLLIKAFS